MRALLAKSQFVEIERLAAFGPRFLNESVKFRARTLVVDDFFPTFVPSCELTQLIKYSAALSVIEFWQLLDDFRCAHGLNIAVRGSLSALIVEGRGYAGSPFFAITSIWSQNRSSSLSVV